LNETQSQQHVPSALLLSMPWTELDTPNLGLSILCSVLKAENIKCRVRHLNLEMLTFLKGTTYYALSKMYALNDFMFSAVLDGDPSARQLRWLRFRIAELLRTSDINLEDYGGVEGLTQKILSVRAETIPNWLEGVADEIASSDATLVGASCMFDQTIASVALLKLVKERAPEKMLALGGYAVRQPTAETVMAAFHWIDAICVQEGEDIIVPLARASTGQTALKDIPGLLYSGVDTSLQLNASSAKINMNDVPTPDFDDYFNDLRSLSQTHQVDVRPNNLPIENSRGCWWGQKKHCVFCGIKKQDLTYRYRDYTKTLSEIKFLSKKHDHYNFRFTDYILPQQYYKDLLVKLEEEGAPFRLDGEMKANANRDQFFAIAKAGFRSMQPGIESLSSSALRKMDKGVTSVQNVYLLRLGKETGVTIIYNILYGFPHDTLDEYTHTLEEIKWLRHLDTPMSYVPVQITRFSPMHTDPNRFGIKPSHHDGCYELIFSEKFLAKSGFKLDDFCYYFERTFENSPALQKTYQKIGEEVYQWKQAVETRTTALTYRKIESGLKVSDHRSVSVLEYVLNLYEARLYLLFDTPAPRTKAFARFKAETKRDDAENIYEKLRSFGLIFEDEGLAVGLMIEQNSAASGYGKYRAIDDGKGIPAING